MSQTNVSSGSCPVDVSVALAANDAAGVPGLIKEINALGERFPSGGEEARLKLAAEARDLWHSLETPRETMIRHTWAQPGAFAGLTAGVQKGLWTYLAKGPNTFKAKAASKAVGVESPVLARMLKHLAAMGYLKEVDAGTYELTNFTRSMAIPIIGYGYPCILGGCHKSISQFHEWAEKNNWKEPNEPNNGPLQYAFDTKLNFFEHIEANPPYGEQFGYHMGGYRRGRPSWMDADFYPVEENLLKGFEGGDNAALLVDIGGSYGHDIAEFHLKHPDAPGRLVLQDLPVVIEKIVKLDSKIERMNHDFYTEQPVKGARAYYMHSVLHDWADDACLKILANIKAALKPGYSKVLINENVIPSTGAHWESTALDMMMLTLLSSKERTQDDWQSLLDKAGLKIIKIWSKADGVESLIECELA